MRASILTKVIFLFLLSGQVKSQCNYSIYFKEWDFFIYQSQLFKNDSIYEIQNPSKNEKVKIKLSDCFGNAEYKIYDLRTDSLISSGRYKARNKLFAGKRWVTLNEAPYSPAKIKFRYYAPVKVKFKK